jgi:[ribosomal protein S5]-alanine N-acetyltransferase
MADSVRGSGRQPRLALAAVGHPGFVLRPWTTSDAPVLHLCFADPAVRHYAGRLIDDRAAAIEAITHASTDWSEQTGASWAVTAQGDQIVGGVSFRVIREDIGSASIGYWLLPEGRGRGLASAAVRAASSTVFARFDWHRIELYHAVENERSCAVARRAGYAFEGVMREAMRYPVDGRWSDEHLHARLRSDEDDSTRD